MPPRSRLASVPKPKPPVRLRDSVDASIAAMDWLKPPDQALADLARAIADQIDGAQERADLLRQAFDDFRGDQAMFKRLQRLEALCDVAKAVATNSQPLLLALRDLQGTPAARKDTPAPKGVSSRLASLRAATAATAGGARVDHPQGVDPAAG
jgi:uncharacterized membrane protein YccC